MKIAKTLTKFICSNRNNRNKFNENFSSIIEWHDVTSYAK